MVLVHTVHICYDSRMNEQPITSQQEESERKVTHTVRLKPSLIALLKEMVWEEKKTQGQIIEEALMLYFTRSR